MNYKYRAAVSASKMFHELRDNRHANAQHFGVYALKKNGECYAQPSVTESTQEYADRALARMIAANPGRNYVVVAL